MTTPSDPTPPERRRELRLLGFFVVVACALTRACITVEPFPYWDPDPTIVYALLTSLGPAASLFLDIVTLLGGAAALLGVHQHRRAAPWLALGAIGAGAAAVAYHGLFHRGGSVDDLRLGSNWLAAIVTGATACAVCRDERLRRLALGAAFGLIAMLALKGLGQVLIEHPQTVEEFKRNRDQFFAAQGWAPDSSAARAFERRLMQNEATGWFGLANVFASVAACASVGLVGMAVGAWAAGRRPDKESPPDGSRWIVPVLALGAVLAVASLVLAGSKGGTAAALLGGVFLAFLALIRRKPSLFSPRLASWMVIGAVGLALLAVAGRALVGQRSPELSVLFRWFYMQGAARIIAGHPILGVGPAGFKDAYMLSKPPLSPEEVTSPHSVLLDYTATLGVAGLMLGALWLAWVWRLGLRVAPIGAVPSAFHAAQIRRDVRVLFLIACVPTLLGTWLEAPAATIEGGLIRLLGLGACTVLAGAIAGTLMKHPVLTGALAAGAIALAAHAQIEVTPVTPGASAWFMLVFGALAARRIHAEPVPQARLSPTLMAAPPTALVLAACTLALSGLVPTWRWESALRSAAEAVGTATRLRDRLDSLASQGADGSRALAADLARDVSEAVGRPVSGSPEALREAIRRLQVTGAEGALTDLGRAARAWPTHAPTLQAASRLALQIADAHRLGGDIATGLLYADRAEALALEAAALPRGAASSNAWLGTVRSARADSFEDRGARERAVLAWESAARLDPRGLAAPVQLAEILSRLGRAQEAGAWARRALALDTYTKLDPLKGLTPEQRARLQALAE